MQISQLEPGFHGPATRALVIARKQNAPAYVVLGSRGQVYAKFPGVWCHRVNPDGTVTPSVITA